jgi:ubiquinone/menaquinone biosynthesis C-methylase UbiE
MVELATRRLQGLAHVHVRAGDVAALPYVDQTFDAAVCTQVYEYVPDVDRALAELRRVLTPGGRAVIVDTDWESCVWNSSDSAI